MLRAVLSSFGGGQIFGEKLEKMFLNVSANILPQNNLFNYFLYIVHDCPNINLCWEKLCPKPLELVWQERKCYGFV